jgi:hypothetical protein
MSALSKILGLAVFNLGSYWATWHIVPSYYHRITAVTSIIMIHDHRTLKKSSDSAVFVGDPENEIMKSPLTDVSHKVYWVHLANEEWWHRYGDTVIVNRLIGQYQLINNHGLSLSIDVDDWQSSFLSSKNWNNSLTKEILKCPSIKGI